MTDTLDKISEEAAAIRATNSQVVSAGDDVRTVAAERLRGQGLSQTDIDYVLQDSTLAMRVAVGGNDRPDTMSSMVRNAAPSDEETARIAELTAELDARDAARNAGPS